MKRQDLQPKRAVSPFTTRVIVRLIVGGLPHHCLP